MKWTELKKLVTEEYDRRNLASNVRYRSLDRIEEFIKSNYDKLSKFFLGSLLLEMERMKCEYQDKSIKIWDTSRIFYKYFFYYSISKKGKIRILNDYITLLDSVYCYKKNKNILFQIYFFKAMRKIMMKYFRREL